MNQCKRTYQYKQVIGSLNLKPAFFCAYHSQVSIADSFFRANEKGAHITMSALVVIRSSRNAAPTAEVKKKCSTAFSEVVMNCNSFHQARCAFKTQRSKTKLNQVINPTKTSRGLTM